MVLIKRVQKIETSEHLLINNINVHFSYIPAINNNVPLSKVKARNMKQPAHVTPVHDFKRKAQNNHLQSPFHSCDHSYAIKTF